MSQDTKNKSSLCLLLEYCKDINEWPNSWAIDQADITIGQGINKYFKLFLIDRIEKARTKSTIKIYARYLWVLGGELINRINDDVQQRQLSSKDLLIKYISDTGGPYWSDARDDFEHARYDSVCKQIFKFINNDCLEV